MANYVYIATSLDGFIATKDNGLDWLMEVPNPDNSDYGFEEFMNNIDAIVMGRNTFEVVMGFDQWPYLKKVFVLSNHLSSIPEELGDHVEIVRDDLKKLVHDLANRGFHDLYIDGGKVIQSFLKEDLIDEMIITRIPVLLGDGIPLFGKLPNAIKFTEVKTEILNPLLVKSHYSKRHKTT